MAIVYSSEYATMVRDLAGFHVIVGEEPSQASQTVAIGAVSTPSAAFGSKTRFIEIQNDAICHIKFGKAQQAADQVWQVDDTPADNAFVDETTDFNSAATGDVLPFPATEATGDYFAVGMAAPFSGLRIVISTAGTVGTATWEYWNGAWTALGNVVDDTAGFTAAPGTQHVTWDTPTDSVARSLGGESVARHYVRARVTGLYTVNPILSQGFVGGPVATTAAKRMPAETTQFFGVKPGDAFAILTGV